VGIPGLPRTGTCDLSTVGRRSGQRRRVEIWYVIIDGHIVLTGTPGTRHWLANLRANPAADLHLREPAQDVAVMAHELTDRDERRRVAEEARRLRPWCGRQPFSVEDWVVSAPMVILTPTAPGAELTLAR
jgi:deazaflavin-dependent oxidoreductase (nitroreductase family)